MENNIQSAIKRKIFGLTGRDASEVGFNPTVVSDLISKIGFDQKNGKYCSINDKGDSVYFLRTEFVPMVSMLHSGTFSNSDHLFFDCDSLIELATAKLREDKVRNEETEARKYPALVSKMLADYIMSASQFDSVNIRTDVRADKSICTFSNGVMDIVRVHNPLQEGKIDHDILEKYKAHVPWLDSFVELIVASIFASDRKRCYVWLKIGSDWGKGFLISALKDLGIAVEFSMEELGIMSGGNPSGKTPEMFVGKYVLFANEVKQVNRHLKALENELRFSPKRKSEVTVPLYLKVLMSAEDIVSLASDETGVEEQFSNRITMIEGSGKLTDVPGFTNGSARFHLTVKNYIATLFNRLVSDYLALDVLDAAEKAESVINDWYVAHSIGNKYETLDMKLKGFAEEFGDAVIESFKRVRELESKNFNVNDSFEKAVRDLVKLERGGENLLVRSPNKLIGDWIDKRFSRSQKGMVGYKASQIAKLFNHSGKNKATAADGTRFAALFIPFHKSYELETSEAF